MKIAAFVFGLGIAAFGAYGIFMPSGPVWLAHQFVTPGAFYLLAAVRIAFGFTLISVAPASRLPKVVHVLGGFILILGVVTALIGLLGIEQARNAIAWWLQQGSAVLRLTAVFILAFGAFIACACAPIRRAGTPSHLSQE